MNGWGKWWEPGVLGLRDSPEAPVPTARYKMVALPLSWVVGIARGSEQEMAEPPPLPELETAWFGDGAGNGGCCFPHLQSSERGAAPPHTFSRWVTSFWGRQKELSQGKAYRCLVSWEEL